MMGHQSGQMAMIFVDMESLILENHWLRKVDRMVSFDFIYDFLTPYYPVTGVHLSTLSVCSKCF